MGLLAGCAKDIRESEIFPEEGVTTVLNVGINSDETPAPETKTYMGASTEGKRKIYWSDGDAIAVNGTPSTALSGLPSGTFVTSFSFAGSLTPPYNVLYPADVYEDSDHIELPSVQTYKEDGFADGFFPMAGYSADGSSVSVSHLCAVVHVAVTRETAAEATARSGEVDADDLVAVRFKGRNTEKVNGVFEINYSTPALTAATGTGSQLEVKVVKTQSTSTATAVHYYVVVPARTYSNGFDIIVQDAKGHVMTKSKTGSVTLVAGKQYNLTEFDFVKTGDETGLEIASADQLIAFATAYNNGEFDDDLVVSLTSDIAFNAASSTSFNETGGIGTPYGGSNYFKGVFNGNSHTISGLTSTVPLFGGIDEEGVVKNFTISNTCSFMFTRPTTGQKYYGAIAGYHKGDMSGIAVNANVSLSAVSDVEAETALGGLVGRIAASGAIDGCTYAGNLSVPAGFTTKTNAVSIYLGGIAGFTQSATTSIKNSHLSGTIDNAAVITAPTENNTTPYLRIGGIIGQNNGTVTDCDTACLDDDSDGAISVEASDGNTYYATIINHTTQTHCLAQGGIVGYNYGGGTVSSCTNRAKIFTNIASSGADGDEINLQSRYFRIGGIVGMNVKNADKNSSITGCDNYGVIVNSSTARMQSTGGIIGWNSAAVSTCTNYSTGTISHITTGTKLSSTGDLDVRCPYVGGVIGENSSTSVSDVHNNANITISCVESDVTNFDVRLGGVIGSTSAAIDGGSATKNITNSGTVYASFGTANNGSTNGIDIGGIVGLSSANIQYAVNSGYIHFSGTSGTNVMKYIYMGGIVGRMTVSGSITGCTNKTNGGSNDGEVYFHFDNNGTKNTNNFAGGILGYSSNGVNISGCTNGGYIHAGNQTTNKNNATCYVGGIVAYLSGAGSTIATCTNEGTVYNHHRNNIYDSKTTSTYTGGIAGEVIGTSENRATISNCTVAPTGTGYVASLRGYLGGVVGYAEYTDISSCSHNKNFRTTEESANAYFIGGIAGWLLNCTLATCTWSGTTINSTQLQTNGAGGIVAKMDGGILDGCYSYVTTIQKSDTAVTGGALVGIALNTPTIKSCHYKASINSAASSIAATGAISEGTGAEVNVNTL